MNLANNSSLPIRSISLVYSASIQEQHDSTKAEGWCGIILFYLPWKIGLGCGFSISFIAPLSPSLDRPCLFSFVLVASVQKCLLVKYLTI